jgi:ABC-type Fe3+/spermidine/putrescine transport system ATPase subunit
VASFAGIKNVFPSKFREKTAILEGFELEMDSFPPASASSIVIRGEEILLAENPETSNGLNVISGRMLDSVHKGSYVEIWVKTGQVVLRAEITHAEFSRTNPKPESDISLGIHRKSVLAI